MRCKKMLLTIVCASLLFSQAIAQDFQNVSDYMGYIGKENEKLTLIYLAYLSAMGHNKSARKVEKRRLEVVKSIYDSRFNIQGMPPWKGDRSYRDTTVAYMKLLYNVFNEDYAKIVNMEEIAEQSYDAMEAYMLAQEKAHEKLDQANEKQRIIQKQFGAKYNVTIVDGESELEKKSKQANDLMKHYNEVYLIFFKPFKQEAYLMEGVDKKNIVAIEQNKNALERFANEGMEKLKKMDGYNNDPSLIVACREALSFFKNEATKTQIATDFFIKEENFNKAKKNFESKPQSQRTQQDVDLYNKAVNEMNASVNNYNANNQQLNKQRAAAVNGWNDAVKKYLDRYMPVQRKQ